MSYVTFIPRFALREKVTLRLLKLLLKGVDVVEWSRALDRSTLLRIYFRNLSVQRSFLQYKSQCLEKVNVKICDQKDYDMKYSISSLVSTLDPYQPSSFAVGLDMGVSG